VSIGEAESYDEGSVSNAFSSQLAILLKSIGEEKISESDVKKLRKDLRAAELKVEMINLEIRRTREMAEEAHDKLREREQDLQNVISQYKALENEHQATKKRLEAEKEDALSRPAVSRENSSDEGEETISEIFRTNNDGFLSVVQMNASDQANNILLDLIESFDGSQLTSVCGSHYTESSPEARDEKAEKTMTQWYEHETTIETISIIKMELAEAKKSAKSAHKKQAKREEHLRDVIFHYKKLKGEYDVLKGKYDALQETRGDESEETAQENYEKLQEERDALKAKISTIEGQLEAAKGECDVLKGEYDALAAQVQETKRDESEETAQENYEQLREERDAMKAKISTIEGELEATKKLAESTKKKQEEPAQENYEQLQEERDALQVRISTIEVELESAKKLAESAKKKQLVREGHLRQVIDQYKKLESEHKVVVGKLEKTKKALSFKRETKSTRNDESLQEKREICVEFDAERVREERRQMLSSKVQVLLQNQVDSQSETSQNSKSNHKRKSFFRIGRGHREANVAK
jgi:chromosome segregation ATPase